MIVHRPVIVHVERQRIHVDGGPTHCKVGLDLAKPVETRDETSASIERRRPSRIFHILRTHEDVAGCGLGVATDESRLEVLEAALHGVCAHPSGQKIGRAPGNLPVVPVLGVGRVEIRCVVVAQAPLECDERRVHDVRRRAALVPNPPRFSRELPLEEQPRRGRSTIGHHPQIVRRPRTDQRRRVETEAERRPFRACRVPHVAPGQRMPRGQRACELDQAPVVPLSAHVGNATLGERLVRALPLVPVGVEEPQPVTHDRSTDGGLGA